MLKAKSLILYSKFLGILLLGTLLSSCGLSYLYSGNTLTYPKSVYVDSIPELTGMIMRNELQRFFPNTSKNQAKYLLSITNNISNSTLLTDTSNFQTQGQIVFRAYWSLIDLKTNKTIISSIGSYNSYYYYYPSVYATNNSYQQAEQLAAKALSLEIALKIINLLKQSKGNLSSLQKYSGSAAENLESPIEADKYKDITNYNSQLNTPESSANK